jgi:hypothetical protein
MLVGVVRRVVARTRAAATESGPYFTAAAEGRLQDVLDALDSGSVAGVDALEPGTGG